MIQHVNNKECICLLNNCAYGLALKLVRRRVFGDPVIKGKLQKLSFRNLNRTHCMMDSDPAVILQQWSSAVEKLSLFAIRSQRNRKNYNDHEITVDQVHIIIKVTKNSQTFFTESLSILHHAPFSPLHFWYFRFHDHK